jgi:hypothetical protein
MKIYLVFHPTKKNQHVQNHSRHALYCPSAFLQ